jgi:hypothetical protein
MLRIISNTVQFFSASKARPALLHHPDSEDTRDMAEATGLFAQCRFGINQSKPLNGADAAMV